MLGGVSSETIRLWIRDKRIPAPDVKITSKSHGWKLSTLRAAGIPLPDFSPSGHASRGESE
jgi:hypothetical protein